MHSILFLRHSSATSISTWAIKVVLSVFAEMHLECTTASIASFGTVKLVHVFSCFICFHACGNVFSLYVKSQLRPCLFFVATAAASVFLLLLLFSVLIFVAVTVAAAATAAIFVVVFVVAIVLSLQLTSG